MRDSGVWAWPIDIPADILDIVTDSGANQLPRDAGAKASLIAIRLRAYWRRLAELARGHSIEADRWLGAYYWAIETERRLRVS